jgi:hypothetical protein
MSINPTATDVNKIVVRYKGGTVVKGVTHDFIPEKPKFHLVHQDGRIEEIDAELLKAIFFVKTYEGDKSHQEKKGFTGLDPKSIRGIKVKITFMDNEVIYGSTMGYNKQRKGFFVLPADPASNNVRIYVVASAIKEIKLGSLAET